MSLRVFLLAVVGASVHFAIAQEPVAAGETPAWPRDIWLRQHFTNFPVFHFLPPSIGNETIIQHLDVSKQVVGEYGGDYWTGIRFTMPEWLDGDFEWVFLYKYQRADLPRNFDLQWFILPERGTMRGFRKINRKQLSNFAGWKNRFPNTASAFQQRLPREDLVPGQTYVIWWAHTKAVVPDIAFAITIDSERGRKEFGSLTFTPATVPALDDIPESPVNFFLQQRFTNFAPVTFLPPTNRNQAVVQRLKVNDHEVGKFGGTHYSGVRFAVPEWADGDLKWTFFHLNSPEQSRQRVEVQYGIVPERGDMNPADGLRRIDPDATKDFWKRYPSTRRAYSMTVPQANLRPGQNYALYFGHSETVVPDIGFAMTIDSPRGRNEFGSLDFVSGPTWIDNKTRVSASTAFLQPRFTNFPITTFKPPMNDMEAAFQRHIVNQHIVGDLDGRYYTGVRFTLPPWLDGDVELAFVHLYQPEDLPRKFTFSWNVIAENGALEGVQSNENIALADLPHLAARFPNSGKVYSSIVPRENLKPGETYVLWWSHTQESVPDIAFAISVFSERGREEFGAIKLH